jgi:hypothetical protein
MIDDVFVVLGDQPEIQRYKDDADAGGRVETLEEEVRIGTEDADAVALFKAECKHGVRKPIDPFRILRVCETPFSIDDGHFRREQCRCTIQKIVDEKRYLHSQILRESKGPG